MPIIPLPFGEGLRRSDGRMVVAPNSFDDLRNVYQYEGKAQVRAGMTETDRLLHGNEATGILTLTGQPLDTETVTIDTKVYTFQTVLTDVNGNVFIGATASDSLDNLIAAIKLTGVAGTDYATSMTLHPTVTASAGSGDTMDAIAKVAGFVGDTIATTQTLTNGTWGEVTLTRDLDVALALAPLRSENAAVGVGQITVNPDPLLINEIWVNRLSIGGLNATDLGLYGQLAGGFTFNPPVIILADSDNKVFIAHDEPNVAARLVTKYYDPTAFPQLVDLQADLDGDGLADVFFRGVVRHLSYIFGWGYGSALEPDRIDVVRVSDGGNPTIFKDFGFFESGQRGEPVMVCRSAGKSLMVFKETETYQIFGYSPDTFGIRPADTLFGCVGSRLAVSVAGSVFFWSVQGPRITAGAESQDIAVPLDLDGPDPATLVAESNPEDAFAEYDPATRVINFVWGKRVYALSIRNPSRPRWSYYELQETAQCGAQFFDTQSTAGGGGQPADGPVFGSLTTLDSESIQVDWDNVGATGGEQVEIHVSSDAKVTYLQLGEATYNGLAMQTAVITGLQPNTLYDFSLRYRRAGLYNPGASPGGSDPSTWPAGAQSSITTPIGVPAPILRGDNNGLWEPTGVGTEEITIGWTIPVGHSLLDIEVERRIYTEGLTATQDVDGRGIGPPDSVSAPAGFSALVTLPAGTTSYVDAALTPHRWHEYRLRFVGGTPYSAGIECWAGPDSPGADWTAVPVPGRERFDVTWINASAPLGRLLCPGPTAPPNGHYTLGYTNNMTLSAASNDWRVGLPGDKRAPYETFGNTQVSEGPALGDTARIGMRHEVTCFGTVYPSYWAKVTATPNYREDVVGP